MAAAPDRRPRRDDRQELALVGDVERVEPEELAGAAHRLRTGIAASSSDARRRRDAGELVQRASRARPASGRAGSGSSPPVASMSRTSSWSGAVSLTSAVSNSSSRGPT